MIRIDWLENFDNLPRVIVEDSLDLLPMAECEFTQVENMWYHIQANGLVRYFSHSGGETNEGGFGGAGFTFLHNGEPKTLMGPWSGRASYLNTLIDEDVVDVELFNGRSRPFLIGILLPVLVNLWDTERYLLREVGEDKPITASMVPDAVVKPNGRFVRTGELEILAGDI